MTDETTKMSGGKKAVIGMIAALLILTAAAYGYGVYYLPSGSVYRGLWKDDQKCNGKQEYSWGYYEGQWANKTWGGYGKEVVYNGPTYEGFWQDNKNAINIVCTYPDGRVAHGKIVDGTFISN